MHNLLRASALLALAAPLLVSAAPSLTDVLANHPNLTQLNQLLTTNMPDFLKNLQNTPEPFTFIAPNDHAFIRVPYTDVLGQAFNNKDYEGDITNILNYHVLPGAHPTSSMNKNGSFQFLSTSLGNQNWSAVTGGQKIGAVLQGNNPPQLVFTSGLSTRSSVVDQDVEFDGGIIQIIDAFAIPPMPFVYTADQYNLAFTAQSILSFLGAVYSQPSNLSLATTLNTTNDLTIFAPANIAMELVSGTLETLSPATLNQILSYHILPNGPVYSADFINNTQLPTLLGGNSSVSLTFTFNSYFVNSARVIASDILIKNGVLHILDNVLAPNSTAVNINPMTYTQQPALPTTFSGSQSFNSSAAPFTTFVPNFYISASPSSDTGAAATGSGGAGGFGGFGTGTGSSSSAVASATKKGKSAAGGSVRHVAGESRWLGIGLGMVAGVALGGCLVL
ncbi:hypothetical protein LTR78_006863 [Recurvomyces mirabilis]|uniref:FAS1 domain-containing protein n=1 Tax=Recurvomyces mirabilis TaxID=574656 RepID=A0AAE0WKC5_9PEZI|nr:hypothetical protein LTR78_006863 [Recurvomyces mirabilis]KAK5153146.1 hypothetical protein LTS14_007791 [Recurvomyces mirabilis]